MGVFTRPDHEQLQQLQRNENFPQQLDYGGWQGSVQANPPTSPSSFSSSLPSHQPPNSHRAIYSPTNGTTLATRRTHSCVARAIIVPPPDASCVMFFSSSFFSVVTLPTALVEHYHPLLILHDHR